METCWGMQTAGFNLTVLWFRCATDCSAFATFLRENVLPLVGERGEEARDKVAEGVARRVEAEGGIQRGGSICLGVQTCHKEEGSPCRLCLPKYACSSIERNKSMEGGHTKHESRGGERGPCEWRGGER